jgi:hypothetical protein
LSPMAVEADRLYVIRNVGGPGSTLQVLQLTEPTELRPLGNEHTLGIRSALIARGALLYVGTPSGLQIVDFADPADPRSVGLYETRQLESRSPTPTA